MIFLRSNKDMKKPKHFPPKKKTKPFGPNPDADRHCVQHWAAQTMARAAELRFISMPRAAEVLADFARELERRSSQL